jgi:hypothetical protein
MSFIVSTTNAGPLQQSDPAEAVAYMTLLLESYPDSAVAEQMSTLLTTDLDNGDYGGLETREALAKALTADVRSVKRDFHLGVMYSSIVMNSEHPNSGVEGEGRNYRIVENFTDV